MKSYFSSGILISGLFLLVVLFLVPYKNFSREYSDFATPEELITRNQILSMPWQKLNGPFGGQGYTIRFSPDNSNKIIVTDSFAGIHISNDKGLTWVESNSGINARSGKSGDDIPVFVTTIDPNDPTRIWCGVRGTMGVFLSDDGGVSWTRKDNGLPDGDNVEIRGLAVKPGDLNTVFAAGDLEEIGPFMGAFQRTQGIVYRTTDGGENWSQVLMGGNLFKDIIIDPSNPNIVYVASGFFDRHQLEKLEGVYKSTDGGTTWAQINNGIRNLYVTNIKFDPTNPSTIWGTTGMIPQFDTDVENQDGSIVLSKDSGMSWSEVKRNRNENNKAAQIYSALEISPLNPNVIYAGAFGIFFASKDGGMSWTETGFGPLGSNPGHPIDIVVDPNDDNTVYVDSYVGGVFKSKDAGKTWVTNAFGYSGSETQDVAISPDGSKVFATSRSGIFLSQDKGINWLPVGLGDVSLDELQAVSPHPLDNNKILLGDSQNAMSSIFLSTDGGMSWKTVFMLFSEDFALHPSSTGLDGEIVFGDIKWAKSNPNIVFASCVKKSLFHDFIDSIGWGTFKSTDGGMSWINKQNGIGGLKNTWAIEVDPNDGNIVYAATNDSGVVKSTDGGENWSGINNGFGDVKSFHSISIRPSNTMVLLAGSTDGQIFRSEDSGSSWDLVFPDFRADDNIVSIIFNPVASTHEVYAGANATGFYVSGDDGQTWQQFNDSLSMRQLTGLSVTPNGDAVYASTNGGGIFRLPISGDALTLTRKQTEVPSNAGIDAQNNKGITNSSSGGEIHETSSGGIEPFSFSLLVLGPALDGVNLNENKLTKSFFNISLDPAKFESSLRNTMVSIGIDLPKNIFMIAPERFTLVNEKSKKRILIIAKPFNKFQRELTPLPTKISLTITQESQGMSALQVFDVPLMLLVK